MLRSPSAWPQKHGLVFAAIIWLAASAVQAQLIYVSDDRGISASVGYDTNSLSQEGAAVLSYSGNYSESAGPSSPFADFSTDLGGSAGVSYSMFGFTNTWTANVGAEQVSTLNALGISFGSSVNEGGNHYPGSCNELSFLHVSFIVSAPVIYDLTCLRGPDANFSAESWRLDSANLGVLVTTPSANGPNNGYGPPCSYSGLLVPGDEYTLTLQETAGFTTSPYGDSGVLQVDFTVPEPGTNLLLGLGLCGFIALGMERRQRRKAAAASALENQN